MEWLGGVLGFKEMDDWYDVSPRSFRKNGGTTLLIIHRYDPSEVVCASIT